MKSPSKNKGRAMAMRFFIVQIAKKQSTVRHAAIKTAFLAVYFQGKHHPAKKLMAGDHPAVRPAKPHYATFDTETEARAYGMHVESIISSYGNTKSIRAELVVRRTHREQGAKKARHERILWQTVH